MWKPNNPPHRASCPKCAAECATYPGRRPNLAFYKCWECGWKGDGYESGGMTHTEKRHIQLMKNGGLCWHCHKNKAVALDHLIPQSVGGPDTDWNLMPSCTSCNSRRPKYGQDLGKIGNRLSESQKKPLRRWLRENHYTWDEKAGVGLNWDATARQQAKTQAVSKPSVTPTTCKPTEAPRIESQGVLRLGDE